LSSRIDFKAAASFEQILVKSKEKVAETVYSAIS
jgi:hypothetical protein